MNREEIIDRIRSSLGDRLLNVGQPKENRLYLEIESTVIPESARLLFDDLQARFQTASGVDAPREMEILYHWVFEAAEWIEREMWELLGISFTGHPDQRHLLLQDDWPEGQYPLRRDYQKE